MLGLLGQMQWWSPPDSTDGLLWDFWPTLCCRSSGEMSSAARWCRVKATTRDNQADADSSILESRQTHKNMLLMTKKADVITIMKVAHERSRSDRSSCCLSGLRRKVALWHQNWESGQTMLQSCLIGLANLCGTNGSCQKVDGGHLVEIKAIFYKRNGWATTVGQGAKNTKTS